MSQSVASTIFVADDDSFTTNKLALGVRDCDLVGALQYAVSSGKRGTRQPFDCRARVVSEVLGGGLNLYPVATELDWIIQRMFGDRRTTFPATPAEPDETLPPFFAWVNKGDEQTFRYSDLRISTLTLTAAEQSELNCRIDCVGSKEEQVADLTSPPEPTCDSQFIFPDMELNIGGTVFSIKSFSLAIDNMFEPGQFENSLHRSIFESQSLAGAMSVVTGYRSDTKALYRRGIAGDAATLTLSNGVVTYAIAMGNVKAPAGGPTVAEVGEITMPLEFGIYRTTSEPMFKITKT